MAAHSSCVRTPPLSATAQNTSFSLSHSTFLENKTPTETPPGSPNGRPRLLNRVLLLRAAMAAIRQTDGLPTTLLPRRERPGGAPLCSLASSVSPQGPACHRPGPASLPMVARELCESQRAASAPGHPGGEGLTSPGCHGAVVLLPHTDWSSREAKPPQPPAPAGGAVCGKLSRRATLCPCRLTF